MPSVERGADQLKQRVAGRAVAVLLGAFESLRMYGKHRDTLLPADALAHCVHVIADHADNAGGVDECGLGLMRVNQFAQSGIEFLLAAHHYIHLAQVGGKTEPVEFGPGR